MRVIAGSARHIQLKTIEGEDTRPTTDRIKETLFNMIQYQLADCVFLDLFSGSGAIGIEALSRGARQAVLVEQNRAAVSCIRENLMKTRLDADALVIDSDVLAALRKLEQKGICFDFIFMDPPYNKALEYQVLEQLRNSPLADDKTMIIVEASLDTQMDYCPAIGYQIVKNKRYKTNQHIFLKKE